jgi:hypothetical protein
MENTTKAAPAKKEKGRVILSTPGFSDITPSNIATYKSKVEKFRVDKKFAWFLSDTMGMTTSWKKGEKFVRFLGAMEDNEKDAQVGSLCAELKVLAMQVADMDPKTIVFESGSAAEREYGKSIDRKIEKEEKAAAIKEAVENGVPL